MTKNVFLSWSNTSKRTKNMAKMLGLELVEFKDKFPYLKSWVYTLRVLEKKNPCYVFFQLPPGPILYRIHKLKNKQNIKLVGDVHTGFIYNSFKSISELFLNRPFVKMLNNIDLVVLHNFPLAFMIKKTSVIKDPDKITVVYDPIPDYMEITRPHYNWARIVENEKTITIPASWSHDENIYNVVKEIVDSDLSYKINIFITGSYKRRPNLAKKVIELNKKSANAKIFLTGFIRDEYYNWLLAKSDCILAFTDNEYTLLSAMWESVMLEKPFIISRTKTIEFTVGKDYPFLFNDPESLIKSVYNCLFNHKLVNIINNNFLNKLRNRSNLLLNKLKNKIEYCN